VADPDVQTAVRKAIAAQNQVPDNWVKVSLVLPTRRLRSGPGPPRQLQSSSGSRSVRVDYDIVFPGDVNPTVTDNVVSTMASTTAAVLSDKISDALVQERGNASPYTVTVTNVYVPRVRVGSLGDLGLVVTTLAPTTTTTTSPPATTTFRPQAPEDEGISAGAVAAAGFGAGAFLVFGTALTYYLGTRALRSSSDTKVKDLKKEDTDAESPPPEEEEDGPPGDPVVSLMPMPPDARHADPVPSSVSTGPLPSLDSHAVVKEALTVDRLRLAAQAPPALPPFPSWLKDEEPENDADAHFWRWAREAVSSVAGSEAQTGGFSLTRVPERRGMSKKGVQRWQAPIVTIPTAGHYYDLPGAVRPASPMMPAAAKDLPLQVPTTPMEVTRRPMVGPGTTTRTVD